MLRVKLNEATTALERVENKRKCFWLAEKVDKDEFKSINEKPAKKTMLAIEPSVEHYIKALRWLHTWEDATICSLPAQEQLWLKNS